MNNNMLALYLIYSTGLILIGAGVFNWELLTRSNGTEYMNSKFGRNSGRILFVVLGLGILAMGYYAMRTGKFEGTIE
ncbi:MAG TPA: hypothetical protein DEP18_00730 [Flavobacteriales bacterium]|nr:hypothetical protein [Flavobacteriales bacterium]HCA82282.1 hypothetical protein [Flavobacteriales bacterium]HRE75066.1 Imm17 family immunity protein [Flavobacteriales bacterium]HRE98392.1 Imm17 family immunity protein [Flavobacteriales bacterium]HRJ35954.1 Imm17 family immunity protein [Flavobacteriales bacterium]